MKWLHYAERSFCITSLISEIKLSISAVGWLSSDLVEYSLQTQKTTLGCLTTGLTLSRASNEWNYSRIAVWWYIGFCSWHRPMHTLSMCTGEGRLCLIIHEKGEEGEFPRAAVASPESRTGNSTWKWWILKNVNYGNNTHAYTYIEVVHSGLTHTYE